MEIKPIISPAKVDAFKGLLRGARKVAITCHMTPDGDAMGSSLGLAAVLKAAGVNAWVITPDTPTPSLRFLPGTCDVVIASRHTERARGILASADVVFCLDYNALKRVDRLAPLIEASKAPRIVVDHHLEPEIEAEVVISHPEQSSTCALLFHLLHQAGMAHLINKEAATCIYTGMLTDTGNFTYNSNDPELYLIIASLLQAGLDKDAVYKLAWNTDSEQRLRICGYAICRKMQLIREHGVALITLSREELNEYSYVKGDTESLVNRPLSIPGITWSVFMRQDEENYVKVSTRSEGTFPVNLVCQEHFGGGGHLNAAGGEYHGTLSEAVDALLAILPDYDKYLPESADAECADPCAEEKNQ